MHYQNDLKKDVRKVTIAQLEEDSSRKRTVPGAISSRDTLGKIGSLTNFHSGHKLDVLNLSQ